jgi:hypothetical protein
MEAAAGGEGAVDGEAGGGVVREAHSGCSFPCGRLTQL